MNEKLDLILAEMQEMKSDVRNLKDEMQEMKSDVRNLKDEMQEMKSDVRNLKDEMQDVKSEMQDMKEEMQDRTQTIEQKVTGIHLILENEIRVNIQRVAEGHLDLSRNLHDAMKPSNEVEMLAIKVRMLESDMREVKAKVL